MLVRIEKRMVDVVDRQCPKRPCFHLGFDKGTYVQGRGYTSYYDKPRPVCWTRHMHGCPTNSVCDTCRTVSVADPGEKCPRYRWTEEQGNHQCPGTLIERQKPLEDR